MSFFTRKKSITEEKQAIRTIKVGAPALVGEIGISPSCGAFSSTATTETAVTNLSVQITTLGNPVQIELQPAESSAVNAASIILSRNSTTLLSGTVFIRRDGVKIAAVDAFIQMPTGNLAMEVAIGSVRFLDTDIPSATLAAGTYTYDIAFIQSSSSQTFAFNYLRLVVYETSGA